ncbi:myeloid cell surface antigen CD33-like [Psammomys obesus]|uniref:myeloid cell surface antigen CD33-like n=1 Tax=Psammomys obesus TaxID=48139 RepID=UPI002452AE08|nr:myeloid cell surface antigen CD33-like [Psammomys obesus]
MLLPRLLPLLWTCDWVSGICLHPSRESTDAHLKWQLVTVQEGLCVSVPCIVLKYSRNLDLHPVFGYWFHEGKNADHDSPVATNNPNRQVQKDTQNRFHLLGDPSVCDCSLDIRDARKSDSGSYFFTLEKESLEWNYYTNLLFVQVTDLTHIPNIDIPQTLKLGQPTNVTCSVPWACERGTPPIFSWMSSALTSLGPRTTLSSVLTLTPRLQDDGTNLTCQVAFPGAGVTVQKTILIIVTWKAGPLAEVVLVAIGEAAIKFLLLGICFLFLRHFSPP